MQENYITGVFINHEDTTTHSCNCENKVSQKLECTQNNTVESVTIRLCNTTIHAVN